MEFLSTSGMGSSNSFWLFLFLSMSAYIERYLETLSMCIIVYLEFGIGELKSDEIPTQVAAMSPTVVVLNMSKWTSP